MRHYYYISDVKLDMYYGQIPPKLRDKIAVDLKIDLKIIGATIKEQTLPESRYQKLQFVERYLRDNENVGSIKEPATFFAGTVGMKYGTISSGSKERGDLVLFGAMFPAGAYVATNFDWCLGLVGSPHHMEGSNKPNRVSATWTEPGSVTLGMVVEHLGQALAHKLDNPDLDDRDNESQGRHRAHDDTLDVVIKSVDNVWSLGKEPEKLEFLAKRLTAGKQHMWKDKTRDVVFGTPLFVAKVD